MITTVSPSYYTSVPTASQTFIFNVSDPCKSSSITNNSTNFVGVENLTTFAGYSISTKPKYTFNDTTSILRTLPADGIDFCGIKSFEFYINS